MDIPEIQSTTSNVCILLRSINDVTWPRSATCPAARTYFLPFSKSCQWLKGILGWVDGGGQEIKVPPPVIKC